MNGDRHANTIKSSNQVHWHARCWHEVASLLSRWPCCSWWRGSSLQPSPWMLFWPSLPRCVSGCWASLEPQRTPPVRQSQTAGKQWARCRWPWRRTLWAAPKPRRCTQRTERAQTGCLNKKVRQAILLGRKVRGSWIYKTGNLLVSIFNFSPFLIQPCICLFILQTTQPNILVGQYLISWYRPIKNLGF